MRNIRIRILSVAVVALVLTAALLLWLRHSGPSYQGKTLAEWFREYDEMWNASYYDAIRGQPRRNLAPQTFEPGKQVFRAAGTNAVPFLVERIMQDASYSRFELWRIKKRRQLPQWLRPAFPMPELRGTQAGTAANLLSGEVRPPGEMLVPMLDSVLRSTNADQRLTALIAIRGIRSGYELARPYVARALNDPDPQVQKYGADAVRWFGSTNGQWAVDRLYLMTDSQVLDTFESAVHALNSMGTNSLRLLPDLRAKLAAETNDAKQKILAHSIDYISGFAPPGQGRE